MLIIRNRKTIITIIFLSFVLATQASFLKNVKVLVETMQNMGNPFTDTSSDLLVLDRQEVRNAGVIDSVSNLKELGERQCSEFFNCRVVQHTTPSLIEYQEIMYLYSDCVLTRQKPIHGTAAGHETGLAFVFNCIHRESSARC